MRNIIVIIVAALTFSLTASAEGQKEDVPGIRNFTRVEPTFACGGSVDPAIAMPELAKRGYKSVVNLRESSENGARIDESRAAAQANGIKFIHLPMNPEKPSAAAADEFLRLAADPSNQPMYFHCASGGRAAALWLIRRMLVDNWPAARATSEAIEIGLASPALKQFALDYVAAHKR